MAEIATVSDVISLARVEALKAGNKIIGLTVSEPVYKLIPDENDSDSVLEFVIDVQLIDGVSQAVRDGDTQGMTIIRNVLIATYAVGGLVASVNTPVEIQKNTSGQLQVIGRAKIKLPNLRLTAYSYGSLDLAHIAEAIEISEGVYVDPFGFPINYSEEINSVPVSVNISNQFRRSTLAELALDNSGDFIGMGVNKLQRDILTTTRT